MGLIHSFVSLRLLPLLAFLMLKTQLLTLLDYVCKGEKKFLGGAFTVESYQDLERASALEGGVPIEEMKNAPGKGHIVTVHDPEGFPISLVYGQEMVNSQGAPVKITSNYAEDKPRIREFLRFKPGPAAVYKVSSR